MKVMELSEQHTPMYVAAPTTYAALKADVSALREGNLEKSCQ